MDLLDPHPRIHRFIWLTYGNLKFCLTQFQQLAKDKPLVALLKKKKKPLGATNSGISFVVSYTYTFYIKCFYKYTSENNSFVCMCCMVINYYITTQKNYFTKFDIRKYFKKQF